MWCDRTQAVRSLGPGDTVAGEWSGLSFVIERRLGEGANGSVFLVRSSSVPSHCALKLGFDAYELQSEVNAVRAIERGKSDIGRVGGRTAILSDDCNMRGMKVPFYTMPYIPGQSVTDRIRGGAPMTREEWLSFANRLLRELGRLHACGWVFGDVKADNVLIGSDGGVKLIDYGGASRMGRSIRQFTELYDRGYWRAGERRADPAYDLFGAAVLLIECLIGSKRLHRLAQHPKGRNVQALAALLEDGPKWFKSARTVERMLRGDYADTGQVRYELRGEMRHPAAAASSWPVYWFGGSLCACIATMWWIWRS